VEEVRRADDVDANAGVLRYLGQGADPATVDVVQPPPDDVDRLRLGAHPDVVGRLWGALHAALPVDARALVAGGPALLDPASGRILAVALGTQYAIWLPPARYEDAIGAGYATVHEFRTVNRSLDLGHAFGPGWVFGDWNEVEGEWLVESCAVANL